MKKKLMIMVDLGVCDDEDDVEGEGEENYGDYW